MVKLVSELSARRQTYTSLKITRPERKKRGERKEREEREKGKRRERGWREKRERKEREESLTKIIISYVFVRWKELFLCTHIDYTFL